MSCDIDEYLCPISMCVMDDPVVLAETGVTYERCEIQAWFAEGKSTCPCTGVKVISQQLVPNRALKAAIDRWREKNSFKPVIVSVASEKEPAVVEESVNDNDVVLCSCFSWLWSSEPQPQPHAEAVRSISNSVSVQEKKLRQSSHKEKRARAIANGMTDAVRRRNEYDLHRFHRDSWSFDTLDDSGYGPIHVAAIQNDLQILNVLLGCGCSTELKDKSGCTALHWASRLGYYAMCTTLVNTGADVNAASLTKTTPLHMAAFWGRRDIIELLVTQGANLHAKNEKHQEPITAAQQSPWDNAKCVIPLLQKYTSQ